METPEMQNPGDGGTPPAPAPQPQPAPAPPPPPPPAPPPAPTPQIGAESGKSGFFGDLFDGVTLVDVGIIALVGCTMFFMIKYYREKYSYLKNEKTQMTKDVEELKVNVQSALGENYKALY
jgi:uncharacterized membrane protein